MQVLFCLFSLLEVNLCDITMRKQLLLPIRYIYIEGLSNSSRNELAKRLMGLYPTVTIRQIMWALKIKPLKRERWETCFDRREI